MSEEDIRRTCSFDVCCQCKLICCQDAKPPLTRERKKTINDYLKKQKINIASPFVIKAYSFPAVDPLGFCLFYRKDTGKCLVHPVKPETCRAGPVTFDVNRQTRKVEWFLKKPEVCALAKALSENEASLKAHFEVARTEILRLIMQLDPEELLAILLIAEPETVKIGEDDLPKEVAEKLA